MKKPRKFVLSGFKDMPEGLLQIRGLEMNFPNETDCRKFRVTSVTTRSTGEWEFEAMEVVTDC